MREPGIRDPFQFHAGQLPALGRRAQRRLADATVLVVGAGRIGTNAVFGLHAAGVGSIEVIDPQVIEAEQVGPYWFAARADIGQSKAVVLGRLLSRREAGQVRGHHSPIESSANAGLFGTADLVICCANTFPARLTAERLAIAASAPIIQAAAFDGRERLGGLLHVRRPSVHGSSCFGCLLGPQLALRRGEGLMPSVTAIIGYMASHVAVLELAGLGSKALAGCNLVILNLDAGELDALSIERRADCEVCGCI